MEHGIKYKATMTYETVDSDGGKYETYVENFTGTKYGKKDPSKSVQVKEGCVLNTRNYEEARAKFERDIRDLREQGYDVQEEDYEETERKIFGWNEKDGDIKG